MFKRLSAVFIALIMCFMLVTPAFAEGDDDTENTESTISTTGTIQVENAGKDSKVKAFQIIEAATDKNENFLGWKFTSLVPKELIEENDWTTTINDQTLIATKNGEIVLTQDDFITIINSINRDSGGTTLEPKSIGTTYQAGGMAPGAYAVFVTPAPKALKIYNPMLVSVNYDSDGQVEEIKSVDASKGFDITSYAYAKSSPVEVKKEANTQTASLGQTVTYTVTNVIPDYDSSYYTSVVYNVTDELDPGLSYVTNGSSVALEVLLDGKPVDSDNYEVKSFTQTDVENKTGGSFSIQFDSDYIFDVGGLTLTLIYKATINENATTGFDPNTNTVTLEYSSKSTTITDKATDEFNEYLFSINGYITTQITTNNKQINFKKTGEVVDSETGNVSYQPLSGAQFTLYTNNDGAPGDEVQTQETVSDGTFVMNQIAAGTYWLVETSAPTGYALDATPIQVVITPTINSEGILESYIVAIGNDPKTQSTTYTATYDGGVIKNISTTADTDPGYYDFVNLTVSSLPSTGSFGTYAFILIGCVIMATALTIFIVKRKERR